MHQVVKLGDYFQSRLGLILKTLFYHPRIEKYTVLGIQNVYLNGLWQPRNNNDVNTP